MKLRCLFGLHGPLWTNNNTGLGPYSRRVSGIRRRCPHCGAQWTGEVIDYHTGGGTHIRGVSNWTRERSPMSGQP